MAHRRGRHAVALRVGRALQKLVAFPLLALTFSFAAWGHEVKPDQIDILPPAVFGDFKQIQDAKESRLKRQRRGNIRKSDRFD